jgi:hypothetical protein
MLLLKSPCKYWGNFPVTAALIMFEAFSLKIEHEILSLETFLEAQTVLPERRISLALLSTYLQLLFPMREKGSFQLRSHIAILV